MRSRAWRRTAWPALIAGLVLVGYRDALGVGFLSDDWIIRTGARLNVPGPAMFSVAADWFFYRPLGALYWWGVVRALGDQPAAYHLLSLALHLLCSLLVVRLAARWTGHLVPVALGAGVVFALLPVQVETVVWLAAAYDLLATLFCLIALVLVISAWQGKYIPKYMCALASYQLALWSKEIAFTGPALVLLAALALPVRPSLRRTLVSSAGFALLLALNLAQRVAVWGSLGGYSGPTVGSVSTGLDRLAGAWTLMLAPFHRLLFPAPFVRLWLVAMVFIVMAGAASGRHRRVLAAAAAWMLITLVPVLALLPVGDDLQSGRLLYLPAVGFAIALAALVDALAGKLAPHRHEAAVAAALAGLAAVYAVALTVHIRPYLAATRVSHEVVDDLHRLVPRFQPGARLEVAGLPDNVQGAYVFRLGFDHAFDQRYGSTFELKRVAEIAAWPEGTEDDVFQVAFAEDETAQRWSLARASGVTARTEADEPVPREPFRQWDFTRCTSADDWERINLEARCESGVGLRLEPESDDPQLLSPGLSLPAGEWLEVTMEIAALPQISVEGSARLYWHTPANWYDESRSVAVALRPDGAPWRYHFFVPPDGSGQAVNQLRLDPTDRRAPMVLERLELRRR